MKDRYSFLAPFYNHLTKLVFGDHLRHAKCHFAGNISGKRILIIGGGDGIDYRQMQQQLHGEYWEISQSMLGLAQGNLSKSALSFHLGYFQAKKDRIFDEVWLHFVLDTMQDEEIRDLLGEIKKSLGPGGRVYLSDFFSPQTTYQHFLQKSMITFFRIVAQHSRKTIPDCEKFFTNTGWVKKAEKEFLKGWVKAQIWELLHQP